MTPCSEHGTPRAAIRSDCQSPPVTQKNTAQNNVLRLTATDGLNHFESVRETFIHTAKP